VSVAWRFLVAALLALVAAAPASARAAAPVPDAAAYLLVDEASGAVLAEDDADVPYPMASTTKIMTGLIALERSGLDDLATVPAEADVGGSTAQLKVGESIRVRDLITGLVVASGNDAAVTLALHVAGSQEAFVALMNRRARELGLEATSFTNPHGLDDEGHHASVADLVTLARAAMANDFFRATVALSRATIPGPGGAGTRELVSHNDLLEAYPPVDGVKTGNTLGAGYAVVAHARRDDLGVALYLAMIGSQSEDARARDAVALLEWGFAQYARPALVEEGQVLGRAQVRGRGVKVPYGTSEALRAPILLGGDPITETLVAPLELAAPVRRGQIVGEVVLRQGERVLGRRPLVALDGADGPGILDRLRSGLSAIF